MATPVSRALIGTTLPRAGLRAACRVVYELAHPGRLRCPVCRTRLLNGDAMGICGTRPAHAECALVHWLAQGHHRPGTRGEDGLIPDEIERELELLGIDDEESLAD